MGEFENKPLSKIQSQAVQYLMSLPEMSGVPFHIFACFVRNIEVDNVARKHLHSVDYVRDVYLDMRSAIRKNRPDLSRKLNIN